MRIRVPENLVKLPSVRVLSLAEIIDKHQIPFSEVYLHYKLKWAHRFSSLALQEYKRFVLLAYISAKEITPSQSIDEIWHLHILHTRDYAIFAEKCGSFLHHNPGLPSQRSRWDYQYDLTHTLYREVFGESPDPLVWPCKQNSQGAKSPMIFDVLGAFARRADLATE